MYVRKRKEERERNLLPFSPDRGYLHPAHFSLSPPIFSPLLRCLARNGGGVCGPHFSLALSWQIPTAKKSHFPLLPPSLIFMSGLFTHRTKFLALTSLARQEGKNKGEKKVKMVLFFPQNFFVFLPKRLIAIILSTFVAAVVYCSRLSQQARLGDIIVHPRK